MAMTDGLRPLRGSIPLAAAAVVAAAATLTSATPAAAAGDCMVGAPKSEITSAGLVVTARRQEPCYYQSGFVTWTHVRVTIQQAVGNTWYTVATSANELLYTCPDATHDGSLALFRVEQDPSTWTLAACADYVPG